jgi:ABC-type uncharacterized transport system substrate-binding protein
VLVERTASIYQQAARGFQQYFGDFEPTETVFVDNSRRLGVEQIHTAQPRLVIAIGTQSAIAARSRFRDTPMVYCLALYPNQNNLTGPRVGGISLSVGASQLFGEVLKLLPKLSRVGAVYNEQVSGEPVREAQKYLRGKTRLITRDVRTLPEAARAIKELIGQVEAFWLPWDPVVVNPANFKLLVELSLNTVHLKHLCDILF